MADLKGYSQYNIKIITLTDAFGGDRRVHITIGQEVAYHFFIIPELSLNQSPNLMCSSSLQHL